jgi:hypothetical protein
VNDPEPEAEFQETVNQRRAMLKAVALVETFAKIWKQRGKTGYGQSSQC